MRTMAIKVNATLHFGDAPAILHSQSSLFLQHCQLKERFDFYLQRQQPPALLMFLGKTPKPYQLQGCCSLALGNKRPWQSIFEFHNTEATHMCFMGKTKNILKTLWRWKDDAMHMWHQRVEFLLLAFVVHLHHCLMCIFCWLSLHCTLPKQKYH